MAWESPHMDVTFYDKNDTDVRLEVTEAEGNLVIIASHLEDHGDERESIIVELPPRSAELLENVLQDLRATRRG